jgi:RyR domain-containing protein
VVQVIEDGQGLLPGVASGSSVAVGVVGVAEVGEDVGFVVALAEVPEMRDPAELADALHQVRDAGLRGKLPFVLWDEFDADLAGVSFGWLRHFLAPMQEGAFRQGQILHPTGKAIFVFAGGTSVRLADFAGNPSAEFRLAKGPDFASRLKGHVDIVGPDPRGGDPQADPYYGLRRAILLRSILLRDRAGLFWRDGEIARLAIDPGVLRAFLEVRSYRHGARSVETIVAISTLHGQSRYERSALPAADQLDAHVDAREFLSIVESYIPGGELLERLAEAVHLEYCKERLEQGHAWNGTPAYLTDHRLLTAFADREPTRATLPALVDYDRLSEHLKEQNRGVARDLPGKLAVLGFVLGQDAPAGVPPTCVDPADPRVEMLAKREHERWLGRMLKAGWRYGEPRDEARLLHPSVRPWEELSEDEQDKDRTMVQRLPEIVAAAGMTLARCSGPPELRIGVTGHRALAEQNRVEAAVKAAVARIEASNPGQSLVVISALAEGAGLLTDLANQRVRKHLATVHLPPRQIPAARVRRRPGRTPDQEHLTAAIQEDPFDGHAQDRIGVRHRPFPLHEPR